MKRADALGKLRASRDELGRRGVRSLSLFGSLARDEAGPTSDADLLVDFGGAPTFDQYMETKFFLEDLLGVRVDLVTVGGLRAELRGVISTEAIRVA